MKRMSCICLSLVMVMSVFIALSISATASKVKLNKKSVTLTISLKNGKTVYGTTNLKIQTVKGIKITKVTYKSANSKIVSVSKKGKLTAKKKGSTKVTAKVKYKYKKRNYSNTLTCKIKVQDIRNKSKTTPKVTSTITPKVHENSSSAVQSATEPTIPTASSTQSEKESTMTEPTIPIASSTQLEKENTAEITATEPYTQKINSHKTAGIISGPVFMFVSGHSEEKPNGELNIICEVNARAFYEDTILNISGWTTKFDIPGNGTYAVCITSNEFRLKNITQLDENDFAVARVYANTVYPVEDNIFANSIPISGLVQREGVKFTINNRKIINYDIEPIVSGEFIDDFGYFYNFKDVWKRNTSWISYKDKQGRILTNSNTVSNNQTDISGKSILCIGDSVTKRGWFQDRIKTYVPDINFIGTQKTYFSTVPCEGYSGRTAKNVLASKTVLLNDNTTTIANPFWNPLSDTIDFSYYCETQNVHPDYIILEFGLNETNANDYAVSMRNFIKSVKDFDSNIKIYVLQPFNAVREIGSGNATTGMQRSVCDKCVLESYTFEDCTLIPAWFIMVDDYDYSLSEKNYGYGDISVIQASDGVHPSEKIGFAKLGDFIYNYLGY